MQRAEERKETSGVNSSGCGPVSAGDQLNTTGNRGALTANRWGVTRSKSKLLYIWFRDKGLRQGIQIKAFYLGGNAWGWVGHKHGYAGPGHSNENKMVRYSTEMSPRWRLQESSGAFQSWIGPARVVYGRLTCAQSLWESF